MTRIARGLFLFADSLVNADCLHLRRTTFVGIQEFLVNDAVVVVHGRVDRRVNPLALGLTV